MIEVAERIDRVATWRPPPRLHREQFPVRASHQEDCPALASTRSPGDPRRGRLGARSGPSPPARRSRDYWHRKARDTGRVGSVGHSPLGPVVRSPSPARSPARGLVCKLGTHTLTASSVSRVRSAIRSRIVALSELHRLSGAQEVKQQIGEPERTRPWCGKCRDSSKISRRLPGIAVMGPVPMGDGDDRVERAPDDHRGPPSVR